MGSQKDNYGRGFRVYRFASWCQTPGGSKGKAGLGLSQILLLFTFSLSTAPAKLKSRTTSNSGIWVTPEKGI